MAGFSANQLALAKSVAERQQVYVAAFVLLVQSDR
jgi:hypothetical protein